MGIMVIFLTAGCISGPTRVIQGSVVIETRPWPCGGEREPGMLVHLPF